MKDLNVIAALVFIFSFLGSLSGMLAGSAAVEGTGLPVIVAVAASVSFIASVATCLVAVHSFHSEPGGRLWLRRRKNGAVVEER